VWARNDPTRAVLTVVAEAPSNTGALTAGELRELVDGMSATMTADGVRDGSVVLVYDTDIVSTVVAALAVARAGGTALPVEAARGNAAQLASTAGMARPVVALSGPAGVAALIAAGVSQVRIVVAGRTTGDLPPATSAPPRVDAKARRQAVFADILGLRREATTLVLLPHLRPLTLDIMSSLLHSRRHVVAGTGDPADTLSWAADRYSSIDVVGLRTIVDDLTERVPPSVSTTIGRVVSIGADLPVATPAGPRVRVEVAAGRVGVEAMSANPGAPVGGFWTWAAGKRDKPAIVRDDGRTVTAGTLLDQALSVARGISAVTPQGSAAPVFVAVLGELDEMLTAYFGAVRAGALVVVASPQALDDLPHLLAAAGADFVVTAADSFAAVTSAAGGTRVHDLVDLATASVDMAASRWGAAGGLLPFTSGTTGTSRAVRRPRVLWSPEVQAAAEAAMVARIGIEGDGRHLVTGRPHQLAPLTTAVAALHAGQTLVALREWSPMTALRAMSSHAITTAFFVPSMFAGLLALPEDVRRELRPRALRAAVHSTAPCPRATKQAMIDWWGPVFYERYGSAESVATYATPDEWRARPGTVGRPFPGVHVAILDETGQPCGPYQHGTVYVSDSGIEYGDGGAPRRRDGLVTVGDVGYLDDEGWLYLVGRDSDYISIGGAKFHPAEVEAVLLRHPLVRECAVVPIPHSRLGQVPVAYVVAPAAEADTVVAAVRSFLRGAVPLERRPARVRVVASLPRNDAGKVLRNQLARMAADDEAALSAGADQ
jgi:long-chain acyl-CoA synthetase